jgi:surface carbohydrate biosynthesis protein
VKRTPRIGLVVDNPQRDLTGLVLTAWHLCQAGAEVCLIPMNMQRVEIFSVLPDLVLLNYLRRNNECFARIVTRTGIGIGVLDTEGGFFTPTEVMAEAGSEGARTYELEDIMRGYAEYSLTMSSNTALRGDVRPFCAWTEGIADFAVHEGWYHRDQIRVTGSPKTDFLAGRWQTAMREISAYVDDYRSPLVLIVSSFAQTNPRFSTPETEARMMVERFGYSEHYIKAWVKAESRALTGFIDLSNWLAAIFPGVTFIYRPHPFEGTEIYRQKLDLDRENLHLVQQGTIEGWLARSAMMIHWSSSSAVDAALLGLPAVIPAWLPRHVSVPASDAVSVPVADRDGLRTLLEESLSGGYDLPQDIRDRLEKVITMTYYQVDGRAAERVADAVLDRLETLESTRQPSLLSLIYNLYRRLRAADENVAKWEASGKAFTPEMVGAIVEAIKSAQGASLVRPVSVMDARAAGAYRLPGGKGVSVVMRPANREG